MHSLRVHRSKSKLNTADKDYRIVIVGGGIAGLTAALSLNQVGLLSTVLEKRAFTDRFGAGIQLTPNATRVLFNLGLEEVLRAEAVEVGNLVVRHWQTGKELSHIPLQTEIQRFTKYPYLQVLRSTLIRILHEACLQCSSIELLPNEALHSIKIGTNSVTVNSETSTIIRSFLVGADGTHSKICELIQKPRDHQFIGWQAWRTTIELNPPFSLDTQIWCGSKGHVIVYPLSAAGLFNLVLITRSDNVVLDRWRQAGTLSELARYLSQWCPQIQECLSQIDENQLFKWGLFRNTTKTTDWGDGRIALIGDAVHPILPFLAQGAAMAMEDALTLAYCLDSHETPTRAFRKFVHIRHQRVKMIQNYSATLGYLYHMKQPWSKLRDCYTTSAVLHLIRSVYDFDTYKICNET